MITSNLYHLDTSSVQWDVTHIYEHLLISEFKKYLPSYGINPDLFGWISGETFENRIFIEAAFYNNEYSHLIGKFIGNLPSFSDASITHATDSVEIEEKGYFTGSKNELVSDIEKLRNTPFNSNNNTTITPYSSLIRKSATDFRDITISVTASNLTPEEEKVFLRLRPILTDIINNYLLKTDAIYCRDVSHVHRYDEKESLKFLIAITARNISGPLNGLASDIKNHIENYPVTENEDEFRLHFQGFASEHLWKITSIEYYRYADIITSPEEIMKLSTADRISDILTKIDIKMRSTKKMTLFDT